MFNDEYQLPIAHSVFKQSVHNVIAHHLHQHTIEICSKGDKIALLINSTKWSTKWFSAQLDVGYILAGVFDSVPA